MSEVQEQEDPVASETEGLTSAVPGREPVLRAEQKDRVASESEGLLSPVTGEPLPAGSDPGFLEHLNSLGGPGTLDEEELGTGRPLPSHLDACISTEVLDRVFPGEQRADFSSGTLSPEAIGLLGDAVSDSVMYVGRSTVEIALPWEASGMNLIFREEDPVDVMLNSLQACQYPSACASSAARRARQGAPRRNARGRFLRVANVFEGRFLCGATTMMRIRLRVSGDGHWKSGWSW